MSGLRAFRHRNYRLFFFGQAISLIGTWMQTVAQGWLVLQLTGDPLWLGLIAAAQFGPVVFLGPLGGVLADQLPKRKLMLGSQSAAMVLAFVLFGLTVTDLVEVWHVILLAVLLGVTNSVDMPARQSFAVEMVGREDLTNAVGLNAAQFNASRIVGPAIAGLLIGFVDLSAAFLLNGLSYVAVIAAYLAMRDRELRTPPPLARPRSVGDVVANLAEGARYVRHTPLVLLPIVTVGLSATFGMNFQVLIPPLADSVLVVGATGFGFLMASSGIGSTISSLWIAFSGRTVSPRIIGLGAVGLGAGSVITGLTGSYPVALLAIGLSGAGGIAMAVTANTTIQTIVPDQLRGRVISVYGTVFMGSVPVGGLLMGWIASTWGVPAGFVLGGVATVAVGALSLAWLQRIRKLDARGLRAPSPVAAGGAAEAPVAVARRR